MALRTEADCQAEAHLAAQRAEAASQRVQEIKQRIISASNEETWMQTGEFEAVVDTSARETHVFPAPEQVNCPGYAYCALAGNPDHQHLAGGQIWLGSAS